LKIGSLDKEKIIIGSLDVYTRYLIFSLKTPCKLTVFFNRVMQGGMVD